MDTKSDKPTIEEIDFKELAKSCKSHDDLSNYPS